MRASLFLALPLLAGITACASTATSQAEPAGLSGKIIIAGDSTAADYPPERAPQIGWGQVLGFYLSDEVTIDNRAVNGRSTKSYIDEGKWAALMETVSPGDLVLISFGHNDSRDDAPERYAAADGAYRDNLVRFADDVSEAGGVPLILSSAARRLWEGPAMVETHGLYRLNAELAAEESDAAYIDLAQLSLAYFETLGIDETREDFFWMTPEELADQLPGHLERYPNGIEDNTHFKETGACGVARVIALALTDALPAAGEFVQNDAFSDELGETGRPEDVLTCAENAMSETG